MENLSEEELPENDSMKMKAMYNEAALPHGAEQKLIDRLRSMNLIKSYSRSHYLRIAATIIILPLLFTAGYFTGSNNLKSTNMEQNKNDNYLLLLYQPKNFIEDEAHVKEYGDWLKSLQEKGQLASGEKLRDTAWLIGSQKNGSTNELETEKGAIGGFFIIKASSQSEAFAITNSCPHLKYNGLIEVRPIEPTN